MTPTAYSPGAGSSKSRTRAEELVGDLAQHAGAVARVDLRAARAAVLEVVEHVQRARDGVVRLLAGQVGDGADAAGVVLVAWVVEASGLGSLSMGFWRGRRRGPRAEVNGQLYPGIVRNYGRAAEGSPQARPSLRRGGRVDAGTSHSAARSSRAPLASARFPRGSGAGYEDGADAAPELALSRSPRRVVFEREMCFSGSNSSPSGCRRRPAGRAAPAPRASRA